MIRQKTPTNKYPCPRRDSNPQTQQLTGRRHESETAQGHRDRQEDDVSEHPQTIIFLAADQSDFSGLKAACWHLELKIAGSNQAEAFGFFRSQKSSTRLPSEGK
jgi:hypothetical protein